MSLEELNSIKQTLNRSISSMETEYIAHCLILPYPFQSHLNQMHQFAKRLSRKRLRITFASTKFSLKAVQHDAFFDGSITIRSISDGFDDGGRNQAKSFEEYSNRFRQVGQETLTDLLQDLADSGRPVDCVIYDPFIPWALEVAERFGLSAAAFFTQSCAVNSINYYVHCKRLELPLQGTEAVMLPGLPPLRAEEMPSFVYDYGSYPGPFQMVTDQFSNVRRADWMFVNTFFKLEEEIIQTLSRFWRVKAIGPALPSIFLDKRMEDDKEYSLSLFKPATNVCINWLNQQQSKSVVYVAFGSCAALSVEQTLELVHALTTCDQPFLWVVRSSEEAKLPKNFSPEKGLIVPWCSQLQVLSHDAVGCFVTHCGWNSTLEGLSLGVPMVAMPQWTDQTTNAKFIADAWKAGVWARADEVGLIREDVIVGCIKRVMEGDEGEEIRMNATKWKEMAQEAVDEGGSSDTGIEEFVSAFLKN